MCRGNMYGGGGCCGGCNCSPELTSEMLDSKESRLKKGLTWVKEKREELAKSDK